MRVVVVGTGYVGLVSGAGLSEFGATVVCVDKDPAKIDKLIEGKIPFFEPGLADLVQRNVAARRLSFTTDIKAAVKGVDVAVLAVGTPPRPDGSSDLDALFAACKEIAAHATGPLVLVTKSTVPVGTAQQLRALVATSKHTILVASNPEFLKEGDAVNDFLKPDRIVIGTDDDRAKKVLADLYRPLMLRESRILHMDTASAELAKYACNAMLAARISFMNELAGLCERVGASVDEVRQAMSSDARIGSAFLYPGVGYGGSCFPKDLRSLLHTAEQLDVSMGVVRATIDANDRQRGLMLKKIVQRFGERLDGKVFAVWGLAFKPRTDDMREAPAIDLIEGLLALGATVVATDPAAIDVARQRFGDTVRFEQDVYGTVRGADAVVVMTEWPEFRSPDWPQIKALMHNDAAVFDGRNIYAPKALIEFGFTYTGIGRRS